MLWVQAIIQVHLSSMYILYQLEDSGLAFLLKQSPELEVLDISHCHHITGRSIRQLTEVTGGVISKEYGPSKKVGRGRGTSEYLHAVKV